MGRPQQTTACGSKEGIFRFPLSPNGKAEADGSPHKRAAAPLCDPPRRRSKLFLFDKAGPSHGRG
jgi:hypothetical protein